MINILLMINLPYGRKVAELMVGLISNKASLTKSIEKLDEIVMKTINKLDWRKIRKKISNFDPYSDENLYIKFKGLQKSYEASKKQFWNDTEVIEELIKKYGEPKIPEDKKEAIMKIFSIIYYGEIVAMIVASQLLEMVDDFDAKKVLAAQVIEEAKHATAYQRYLSYLGKIPEIELHSKRILDDIMKTKNKVLKMIGMQLLVENVAFNLFTAVKQVSPDPVLRDLLGYIAMDEAKHVGLARKYLPQLINQISFKEHIYIILKQFEWLTHIIISILKQKKYAQVLGIDVQKWVKLGTNDFLKTAYEIIDKTKFKNMTIPKSFSEKLSEIIVNTFFKN